MSWLEKLRQSGTLTAAKEVARFACKNFVAGGGLIADAIDSYERIQDERARRKVEEILAVVATDGKEVLAQAKALKLESEEQIALLAQIPTTRSVVEQLPGLLEAKVEGLVTFLAEDLRILKQGQVEIIEKQEVLLDGQAELKDMIVELRHKMDSFKRSRGMESCARLSDSLLIRSGEREMVKKFLDEFRALPPEKQENSLVLTELGALIGASGRNEEAEEFHSRAAQVAKRDSEKALIWFNRYINHLEEQDYEQAFVCYTKSLEYGPDYALFEHGKYLPTKILGAGGFGTAFVCRSVLDDEKIVVKSLSLPPGSEGKDSLALVLKEAGALKRIDSPYIIRLEDFGYLDWSSYRSPFLVMEYFSGCDIERWIGEYGAFSPKRGLEIARAIARGLRDAHKMGVIHRDLKPANVLYREIGDRFELKIIDFGLALRGEQARELAQLAGLSSGRSLVEDAIAGTFRYAPPEQMGESVDNRIWEVKEYSDVYAYGRTLRMIFFADLEPKKRALDRFVNQELIYLIDDCLERDPSRRPQNFEEVLHLLDEAVSGGKVVFPSGPGVTPKETLAALPSVARGGLTCEDLFAVEKEIYSEEYRRGEIVLVRRAGAVRNGEVLERAVVVLSKGRELVAVEFPSDPSQPFLEIDAHLVKGKGNRENCFTACEEYHETVPENSIIRVEKKGKIIDGKLSAKAQVVVSAGPMPEIVYPSQLGLTFDQAHEEIQNHLEDQSMLASAFNISDEEYSEEYSENTICKICEQGVIKAGVVRKPAVVVVSKGGKEQAKRNFQVFRIVLNALLSEDKNEWLAEVQNLTDKEKKWFTNLLNNRLSEANLHKLKIGNDLLDFVLNCKDRNLVNFMKMIHLDLMTKNYELEN